MVPFLEGVPRSIHGVVTVDDLAALRPREMIVLRDGFARTPALRGDGHRIGSHSAGLRSNIATTVIRLRWRSPNAPLRTVEMLRLFTYPADLRCRRRPCQRTATGGTFEIATSTNRDRHPDRKHAMSRTRAQNVAEQIVHCDA